MRMNKRVPENWTADEIAECWDGLSDDTMRELWTITTDASNAGTAKPLGGDGTGGTREFPEYDDSHANCMKQAWDLLCERAQREINAAAQTEGV